MAVFIGCQVVFELSTAVKFKEKQKLRKLVTENGGIVSFIVTKKSTHVVCDDPEKADTSYKCRMAMKYGIPVVSPKYLQRSKDTSVLQKTDDFIMVGKSKSETLREGKITASKYQKTDKKKAVKPFINVSGFKVWNETDKNCPEFTSDYQVAKFAVFQNQKKEKNKTVRSFVVIEVHVDDSFVPNSVPGLKYKYRVACHSGVLELIEKGEDGLIEYRFCATVDETLAIYSHLYNLQQQKGMEVVFNVLSRHIGSDKFKQMMSELGLENIDISKPVKDLVQHIWQEAQGELDDIISETVTNTEQVDKAEAILKQIKSALDNGDKSKVSKLMADFYGTIPHHLSKRDMSCSKMWLSRKQDLCQLIRDMLSVSEATDWSTTSSTQSKYKALRCVIEDLSRASPEFQQMENLVTHSVIGNTKPTIQNIFAVSRPVESVQYTQHLASTPLFHATKAENLVGILSRNTKPTIHNTFSVSRPVESVQYKHHLASTPLFHATKAENLVGILSRGLLLPRVVVDDHGGKRTDPGMLGAGIYFANAASTSIKYSHPSDTKGTRFILINEVALGKTVQMYEKDMTLTSAPEGYQSVHGVRSSDGRKSAFQDDEFVIYNTSQQRMKYLVEFTLQDDKVKDTADDLDVIEDVDLFLTDDIFGLEDISLNDVTNVTDPMSKVKAGLVSKSDAPVNLKAVHIRAKLLDLASEVVVLQEYENNSKTALEAKYVFPLGDLAAVCGFEAFINGKHIVGEVKEKEKAHKEYKKAISEGHGAYLMDQDEETPDIFTVSVGNLPPGASVLIKITYVAELQVEGELINFQLPGSVAPWKKQSLKEVTQHETETHEVKQGETSVQVAVDMPFDIRTIECPSHQIKVKRTLTKATVEMLENQSIADGFQLLIGLAEIHVPRMWVERKDGEPNHQACMLSFYPEFEACEVEDVNVVLLLDLSNSMKGDNLNNTKKIALLTLQHLPSSWNFNIVVFGTAFKELFPGCVKKTPANVKSASEFIRGLTATMGNTEVIRPMHTFYLLKPESTVQNVFLISDGHINNEEIMMKKAFENFQHTRIFTMGVGSTANRHLLRALSRVAAGAYEFFDPKAKSKWERKVKSHINKAAQPGLTSVHVDWEQHGADVSAPVQAPRQITALFSGSRQVIYGFVPNCTMATLHANIAGEGVSTLISTTDLSITTGKILHRLAAKAIINDWEDGVLSADKTDHEIVKMNTKDYIIELSKEYSIVTQFTSFVAIEKRDKDDEKAAIDAPSMSELIEKENVDQLAYMGFEETKKTDLDYTHDIEDLLVNIRLNFDSKEKQNEFLRQAFKLTEQITDEHVCSQNRVNLENAFFDWELSEQFDFETEFGFKPKRAVKPPITVCVLTLTGRPIYVEIDENCSIRDLKEQVHKEEGTPPDEQRLLFGGRQVDDTRTLKDCDIQNLDVVHLLVRLRAGGTGPEQPKAKQRTRTIMKKASSGLWQVPSMATAKAKQLQTSLDQETTMSFNRIVPDSSSKLDDPSAMMPKLASKFARRSAPVAEKITILSSDDESLSGSEDDLDMDVYNKVEEEIYDQGEFVCDLAGFDLDDELSVADAMHSLSDEDSDMIAEEEGKKERVTFKEKLHAYCIEDDSDDFCEDSEDEDSDMISEEEGTKGRGKVALQTENEVDDREDEDSEEKDRFMMFGEDTKHKGKVTIEMEKDEEEEDADVLLVSSQGKSEISIWDRARMAKLDSAKQQRITRMMAVYLVKDMRPFSTVQSVNFRNMIHAIDARVVIPNSDTFSQRIIPSWYNIEVAKLMEELQSTKHVSLTSDCWTSRTTIPYMTVTAHFLDENYDLKSKVLQTRVLDERHTGENISVALNSVLQSWKIDDKVSVITTDNASNMGRAVQISDIPLQIGCFAHTLDLAAKKAVEVAKPLSKHMKPVINFLHRSHIGAKVIKEKQEALNVPTHKLITDIETRWNSTYLMFERYFEQRVAIHATFMDKRLEAHKSVYRDFKDSEVVKAEEFLETMKPFYEMTLAICSEKKPTASLILPLCDKILKRCEPNDNDSDFTKQLKKAIGDNLSKRYNEKPVRDYLLKCTALDPRMKLKSIVQESTWQILSEEIVELLMCFGLFDDGTMSIPDEEICLAETIEADKSVMPEVERFKMEELCRKAPFSGQEKREKKKKKSVYFEPRALQQPPARKKVAEDLLDVQEVLARNVDQVLERGERLDSLVEKSEHLHEKSTAFFRASLEDDLNGSGRKTATDGKRSHTEQVGKGRIGTMMGAVPPPMLESTFSQMSEDKSIDEGALLFGRKPKSGVRHHCFSRPDSQRSVHMFGGMSRALSPQSASGQAFGSPVLMDMSLTEKSADRGEVLFGKTAAPFEYMLRDGAPQMAAREMAPPPPRSPVSYSHSTKQMAIVGFGFGQAFGQSQQFPLPPSGGPASFGFMSLDGTLERGASEVAQTAPPLVTPHAVAPQVHASTHFCFSEPVTQSQKFTPPPPPPLPSQRLSVEAPKPHLSRNLGMLQFQSFDVQAPSYPPIPHFLPPPGGPPPVPGAPPCPPKGQTLTFDGPPPPPKNKGPTIVSHGPPPLPRGPSSASDGPPPPPRGPPLTTCRQSSTPPQQLGKPQRLSRVHRSSGYSSTTMGISRQDTEEARLLTEFEKPSEASMVSWRKERSRSPGVSTDKRSASSRDTLLSSIKEGRTLKRTTKPNAEKKESLVKELKSALMMRRSKLVEEDVDTPLLNDYEELSVITIDSLERADKPFKTGSITAGSPVLSDYGIGIQVPYIVRGKLDHTKKEEILTMIQYSQSKDGFWEIQPGSQLEAFLSIDMSLVEEVLNRAGLRSLGLSVYTDVVRVVSSVIVMLTVLELYLPDAFPLDFNDPVIEEKVLSDFENALMAGSFERMMMVQRAFEFRLMIDEKIPLACKMLELGASWTHFVARMMDLHRESQEKGPVLYLHGLEQSQRMGNPIRA